MSAFDFKEIPLATSGSERDAFELFARDFLELSGFKVLVGPDRGADAGRDLIVEETRSGITGDTKIKWLVSCKHKAHSGASVTPADEQDIHDRLRTHGCVGFLGFYSTIPSTGLAAKLNAPNLPYEIQVYDSAKIERHLLSSPTYLQLAKRYFPKSLATWSREHPEPAKLFRETPSLKCHHCQKELLSPTAMGIIVIWRSAPRTQAERLEHVYWCCKGKCDQSLKEKYSSPGLIDGWKDIPDLTIPLEYIRWIMTTLNEFYSGVKYSEAAHENTKDLLLNIFPSVSRHMTADERTQIQGLGQIPAFLGGWGYEE